MRGGLGSEAERRLPEGQGSADRRTAPGGYLNVGRTDVLGGHPGAGYTDEAAQQVINGTRGLYADDVLARQVQDENAVGEVARLDEAGLLSLKASGSQDVADSIDRLWRAWRSWRGEHAPPNCLGQNFRTLGNFKFIDAGLDRDGNQDGGDRNDKTGASLDAPGQRCCPSRTIAPIQPRHLA